MLRYHTIGRDVTARVQQEAALTELATTDALTGLLNRRAFEQHGAALLARCEDEGRHALLAFCDVNGLKVINDRLGHEAGELAAFAARRFPNDIEVRLFAAESMLLDRKDPQAAIAALASIDVPPDNRILRTRRATLQADAFEQAGQKDAAVAVLQPIVEAYPTDTRLKQRLDELKGAGPAEAR